MDAKTRQPLLTHADAVWWAELLQTIHGDEDEDDDNGSSNGRNSGMTDVQPPSAADVKTRAPSTAFAETTPDLISTTSSSTAASGSPSGAASGSHSAGWIGKKRPSIFGVGNVYGCAPSIDKWGVILMRRVECTAERKAVAAEEWGGWQVLVVESKKCVEGFPRGRRTPTETARQVALRKLSEQTGFSESQWSLTGQVVTEHQPGYDSIGYFVATMNTNDAQQRLVFNPYEHRNVSWKSVASALLSSLKPARKQLLHAVVHHLSARD